MSRSSWLATGTTAAVIAGGFAISGIAGASPSSQSHTLHLTLKRISLANTSATTYVQVNALSKAGKRIGYETLSCNDGGTNDKCAVTYALPNGFLLGHFTIPITTNSKVSFTGKITGGLGRFTGDTGTTHESDNGSKGRLTLRFG